MSKRDWEDDYDLDDWESRECRLCRALFDGGTKRDLCKVCDAEHDVDRATIARLRGLLKEVDTLGWLSPDLGARIEAELAKGK